MEPLAEAGEGDEGAAGEAAGGEATEGREVGAGGAAAHEAPHQQVHTGPPATTRPRGTAAPKGVHLAAQP